MPSRLTQKQVLDRFKDTHGSRYDYSKFVYHRSDKKSIITCSIHGDFLQDASSHWKGFNCYECGRVSTGESNKKHTTRSIIVKFKEIHDNKYDYSKFKYTRTKLKGVFICPTHGEFKQKISSHLSGRGCEKCGKAEAGITKVLALEKFIENSKKVHGNKYDYSDTVYTGANHKLKYKCPKHGIITQEAMTHSRGFGCPKCGNVLKGLKLRSSKDEFVKKIIKVHGDYYNYSKFEYVTSTTKSVIICPRHGDFKQSANTHLGGHGCPSCSESTGEKTIRKFLDQFGFKYVKEKRFDDCRNIKTLPFDFCVFGKKEFVLIEYQGSQHYKPIGHFGGKRTFDNLKKTDEIKRRYCLKKGIKLIIIPYWKIDDIFSILFIQLKEFKDIELSGIRLPVSKYNIGVQLSFAI